MKTIPAISIGSAHPRDANSGSNRQLARASTYHCPDDLVPRNDTSLHGSDIALNDVEVSSADNARQDTKKEVSGFMLRAGDLLKL
jgi:hypothetical protein